MFSSQKIAGYLSSILLDYQTIPFIYFFLVFVLCTSNIIFCFFSWKKYFILRFPQFLVLTTLLLIFFILFLALRCIPLDSNYILYKMASPLSWSPSIIISLGLLFVGFAILVVFFILHLCYFLVPFSNMKDNSPVSNRLIASTSFSGRITLIAVSIIFQVVWLLLFVQIVMIFFDTSQGNITSIPNTFFFLRSLKNKKPPLSKKVMDKEIKENTEYLFCNLIPIEVIEGKSYLRNKKVWEQLQKSWYQYFGRNLTEERYKTMVEKNRCPSGSEAGLGNPYPELPRIQGQQRQKKQIRGK